MTASADELVARVRAQYPDLTEDEEAAIRLHLGAGTSLFLRCKFSNRGHGYTLGGHKGIIIGADFTQPRSP